MRRILTHGFMLTCGASLLAGCTDESLTSVGGDLIGEGYRTYQVVLDADAFLQDDHTYTGLGSVTQAPFVLVAEDFADELSAHALLRVRPPTQVTYENAEGTSVTDTAFTVVGGTLTLIADTLGERPEPVQIHLLEVTESWDPATVTWEQRFDTAGVSASWMEPGGTTGQLLATELWAAGDTLRIPLDSAAAAVWTDSAAAFRGGLIQSATAGTRLRMESMKFTFNLRPASADTVVPGGSIVARSNVVTPEPDEPSASELRVGGVPVWRSTFQFRPLTDVRIPCPPSPGTRSSGSVECTSVSLADVTVNFAALLLHPVPVAGRRIERPFRIEGRAVLRAPGVPIERSPLTPAIGRMEGTVTPDLFRSAPAALERVAVPVTNYVRQNLSPPGGNDPVLWLALLGELEQSSPVFGYAAFSSIQSANPPQLQLVVTVPSEE